MNIFESITCQENKIGVVIYKFYKISPLFTCVEVDHILEDFDATDIPDDVREVVKFLVDGPL